MKARKRVVQGGTWAGKTFGIAATGLIDWATKNGNKTITVTAETIPALKAGAIKDFKSIMEDTGRWFEDRWHGTDLSYTFANKTKVEFKSFDSVGKAKAAGKRNVLFINEANHISFEIADALITRTDEIIWIDFNPDESFWVHEEIIPQADCEFLLLKYTDNESCPDSIIKELEAKQRKADKEREQGINGYWSNWCKVYIDGEIGSLQGVVFNNWQQCEEMPDGEFIANGLDFGFTNDPTAGVRVIRHNGTIYIDELIYETGLTNSDIANKIKPIVNKSLIVADSAEPKSIEELTRLGLNVEPASKGKDSVKASIDILQQHEMRVTSRSVNLIKELRTYQWLKDKNGKLLNEPTDYNNHAIDALRYVALNRINKPVIKMQKPLSFARQRR